MSSSIQKVAIAGVSGNLGPNFLDALLAASFTVTALTRRGSKSTFDPSITVRQVDYHNHESMKSALIGHDAVVVLGVGMLPEQTNLIDAAISAGVPRFIPAEYANNIHHPLAAKLPINETKLTTAAYLEEKAAAGQIGYTVIRNGPLFDTLIKLGVFLNIKERKVTLYDGGDTPVSTTTTTTVGKAVVAALKLGEASKNKTYYVQDAVITQMRLLEIARREITKGEEWRVLHADTADAERDAWEAYREDEGSRKAVLGFRVRTVFGKEYGAEFKETNNSELGIPTMKDEQIKELLSRYA